ncbi:hypothetical protein, partial [Streptomyces ureilyticus]|uniref:hypothetical protein n=1 Tax=Streptomyces ureilyticus TaxID=1775131 RepID=UPI0019D2C671
LPTVFLAVVTWLAARLTAQGQLSVGELVSVYGYVAVLVPMVAAGRRAAMPYERAYGNHVPPWARCRRTGKPCREGSLCPPRGRTGSNANRIGKLAPGKTSQQYPRHRNLRHVDSPPGVSQAAISTYLQVAGGI